ncbi:MAG: glycerate kinase [Halanaerobiales bacterium]|nr:glycerate kinase [Halanaerobiales bacterium]
MRILLGPDSLKGSLRSIEFCNIAEEVVLKHWPEDEVIKVPLADGGEGTVESLVYNTGGHFEKTEVYDPLGRPVTATYGILGDGDTAVIEMAEASGFTIDSTSRG